ncbi:MAG: FkbM family methyltransferase [Sphingobacteriia bacterium]|jgi:predicted RNA methylase
MSFIKNSIPGFIKNPINRIRNKVRWRRQFKEIINYYDNKTQITEEEKEVINYLKKIGGLVVYPYEYTSGWDYLSIETYLDKDADLFYVLHNQHRLYFKRGMTENEVKGVYFGLLNEQSDNSPHLYLTEGFSVDNGSVVADFGAAEGIFTLNVIEKVSQVYLFEPDPFWIEALTYTFKPWKHKVEIVNKLVGNELNDTTVTVDNYFKDKKLDFIKADIEGSEAEMLEGAIHCLKTIQHIKLAITTYHKQFDYDNFSELLSNNYGFQVTHSYGYMLYFINNNLFPPYLRRGILRAEKKII